MCHKKISQSHADNTTDKTNVGPHVASVAKHHADSSEKIQHAKCSRKKLFSVKGNYPSKNLVPSTDDAIQKHGKTRGVKSSPSLHKKTVKNGKKSIDLFHTLQQTRSHGLHVAATRIQLRIEVDSNYHV